jgi:hypothetical protein
MKNFTRLIAVVVVIAMLFNLVGCYGSFALTKKVYDWNGTIGDKWINTVVMWILMFVPVYNVAGFIDIVVLNTIEFWTGSNPVTMNEGDQSVKYASNDGKTYKFVMTKNNINILETIGPDAGKSININYSPETGNWTMNDGKMETVIANVSDSNLKLIFPNGDSKNLKIAR